MGMTIEEAIRRIEEHNYIHQQKEPRAIYITEAFDTLIDIVKKYQKIEQILKDIPYGGEATVRRIQEVIEDEIDWSCFEAIPKAVVQKAYKEASKDICENVLAIVREDYISKAEYENRLKADMVVMLDTIRAEIKKVAWEDVVVSLDGTDEVRIPRLDPDDVFEIIDKYRGDSEDADN